MHIPSFRKWLLVATLGALAVLMPLGLALAQSGWGCDLGWRIVEGGGYTISTGEG
jgi:hypothetical protein